MHAVGIDIGGSGVKGAVVDLTSGALATERIRYDTPEESKPEAVAEVVRTILKELGWAGPVGITYPGVVYHGVIKTAANVDKSWIDVDGKHLFEWVTGCPVRVLNDADAAGIAEMTFGAGRGRTGVTIMLTFGTGIGTALFVDNKLLPNTELGHLQIRGKDAEHRAAARIRKEENLTWPEWAARVNEYLAHMEFFFSPDLFIIGGGVSKKYDKFLHYLKTRAQIVPAQLLNEAGIIGAAMHMHDIAIGSHPAASALPAASVVPPPPAVAASQAGSERPLLQPDAIPAALDDGPEIVADAPPLDGSEALLLDEN